jgi:hypothetical protein
MAAIVAVRDAADQRLAQARASLGNATDGHQTAAEIYAVFFCIELCIKLDKI